MVNLIGQSLGRYNILEQLGEGGMAIVYKAYDTRLERDVAIKVIRTELFGQAIIERILKRFEREAKALAKLSHPNIVSVIDYGEHEGAPYLILVYLPGGTLKQLMGKPMRWQDAAHLLSPVADALQYAHEHNVVHRDVKPSNILLTEKGQPMLTDFGIAKILDLEDGHTLTGTGVGIGTAEYMAPEQAMGKDADARADIYSLGIVFYELITGRRPYVADTPMAVILKQVTDPLPSPKLYVPDLPQAVEKVITSALAKNPDDRYQDAETFSKALENLQSNSLRTRTGAANVTPQPRKRKPIPDALATSIQSSDEYTVDQFETSDQDASSSQFQKHRGRSQTSETQFVYIIVEDGTPLYHSLPSSNNWTVWLKKGAKLTLKEPKEDASNIGKYGQFIEAIDNQGNEGYIAANAVSIDRTS